MPRDAPYTMAPVKDSITIFGAKYGNNGVSPGGLDLLTPSLTLQPGACRDMQNFECAQNGGYSRIGGYERYDGRPAPSDATFTIVQVVSFVNVPSVGDPIAQSSSGASGTVAAVVNNPGSRYMVVTQVTGAFDTSGVITSTSYAYSVTTSLTVTAATSPWTLPSTPTTIGTATTTTVQLTAMLNAQYQVAAADIYRDEIEPVPGSGPLLAVIHMIFSNTDYVYAFRANEAGNAVKIWRASAAGWVNIPLYNTVAFTAAGGATPVAGQTLSQGPASATIKMVMISSGTIAGSSAAGVLVVETPNLGFAAGAATTSGGGTMTLSGAQEPIVIQPGGTYEWAKYNFSGQLATRCIYGCDGVNKAFVFDGTTYAPITSGLSAPSHIAAHKNHLFLAQDSSTIYSADGDPFRYSAVDNGGEIATGDTVSAMLTLPGNESAAALGIWMRSTTGILYGTGSTTFNFVTFNFGTGANERSVQNLYDTIAFPDLGIISLQATLNYGNFLTSTLTKNIQPFINQQRTKISASSVQRSKGQYRVFFDDGYGLYLTFANTSYLGAAPVLFLNPVATIDEDTTFAGEEVTYFGSSDEQGYVYQLDKGPSFDGENLYAYFISAWDYIKTPRFLKQFRCASIEMQGSAYAAIGFNYALGDNSSLIGQPSSTSYSSSFSPAQWDNAYWDNFFWDGQTVAPTYADMTGTAQNVQPTISCGTNYIEPFNVSSIIYQYSIRRRLRGM
jgi:hypothetical protein